MSNPLKSLIRDLPPAGLTDLVGEFAQPEYRGGQLARWLFRDGALAWDQMTNLPGRLRRQLADRFDLCGLSVSDRVVSRDGTRKFLFSLRDGAAVESVLIPTGNHPTFCLSSQVGCAMGCRFCASARGGLVRNLRRAEILEQVIHLQEDLSRNPLPGDPPRQFNLVVMGMGEPLHNWDQVSGALFTLIARSGFGISSRRITVSTAGPANLLTRLLDFPHPIGLTVSLGGAPDRLRRKLLPVAGKSPLTKTLDLAERYARRIRRPVTLALVLIAGVSDSLGQARRLATLVRGKPFKVNLIPLNRWEGAGMQPADPPRVQRFGQVLQEAGIRVFVRESGGQDIAAACGQLRLSSVK